MPRIFSISLGCPKNRVDTERTLGALGAPESSGFPGASGASEFPDAPVDIAGPPSMVARPEEADLVFINTCGFIAPAVTESVRVVLEMIDRLGSLPKAKRPMLVVAGCLVGRFGKATLAPDLPEADCILDNRELPLWAARINEAWALFQAGKAGRVPAAKTAPPQAGPPDRTGSERPAPPRTARLLSTGPSYAWLKISDGCRHACSFCTIPSIRGPLRSTPAAELKEETRFLLDQGVKEIVVVAQDVTAWGLDFARGSGARHGLRTLLDELLPLPGLERLRLMYLYPAGLSRELLHYLKAAGPPFVPYFDVPVQHAAENVLARMGRPFARNPHEVVDRIREVFPEAALRTSIIVGFPGETESDFEELCAFVSRSRFHHLGVFAYQAEEGTPAAEMADQTAERDKEWRRDSLMDLQGEISEEILETYVGGRQRVLVDSVHGEWPGLHVGRTWFQAPESDGVTYVSGPGTRPGAMVEADITEASTYDLVGLTDAENE